jgi:hypothetical protein
MVQDVIEGYGVEDFIVLETQPYSELCRHCYYFVAEPGEYQDKEDDGSNNSHGACPLQRAVLTSPIQPHISSFLTLLELIQVP